MTRCKALVCFSGKVSMRAGEVRELNDPAIVNDLIRAGYIENMEQLSDEAENEQKQPTKRKTTRKRTAKE